MLSRCAEVAATAVGLHARSVSDSAVLDRSLACVHVCGVFCNLGSFRSEPDDQLNQSACTLLRLYSVAHPCSMLPTYQHLLAVLKKNRFFFRSVFKRLTLR